ncbi:fumarylacetoacetate hydrolase family protein [Alicyclobacillus acidocaldarius]|uniref:5-carboxymethyl-2-hydroxymuconateDelta-isomerase n=1 Tax=Alicyclobacillus acidocaldarius subsp. acidocaldarius (strain ATCC 27009 / DSM 446 / BCRC 14685 / JCM 5260 / KCTC 1825 / NBRC 15652 / NCIMB 11725 / NRRL B-14509 / 104-IA) TaxID=521098 RepID=C8WV53_ALIAD|nr:fumarylacetoacetate hydrolase family protein [Alicyclobacillus acidocaldarius]ACV59890.1 5-carboxymethyl-2-hydroxymuconateDelta-isomerase [Alicyclobacillus acidocaldarius subsp. acidocaldarius DSM 446]
MKLCTYREGSALRLGLVRGDEVVDVAASAAQLRISVPETMEAVIAEYTHVRRALEAIEEKGVPAGKLSDLRLAPPVTRPQKILCVGLNYRKHAEESKMPIPSSPVYFAKFANSLAAHGDEIAIPEVAREVDYEVELVAVIGRRCRNVSEEEALGAVFGYAIGNDLSARDLQMRASQWLYGKAIDGFAPLGPYIATADEVGDPQRLGLRLYVNGELRQNSSTADMIFSVAQVIADLSRIMTLEPGDLVYTGTPEGVILGREKKVWLKPGDEMACEIDGLGRLENRLVAG